ncbi:chromate efflux transporter [Patiriisocius marinus]|uniref:Chromate transporter n=1 Tax=Patiriisocius marinus TaxID=1397112 RepID=A0A5J4IMG5_9FLAO|nr:chromate efflux transporter [Patiriisocius marinus]GER58405.1 chromate transporter [Patiriisocius marinus]
MSQNQNLKEVATVFFKLGCFAFGGPAAHIAMMEDEIVTKRKWMTRDHYLDLIGATNLIPGPNSTEMTMHCGHERAGKAGLFVAGISFIFPAIFITGILAYFYVTYGTLPQVAPFIKGIQPAVLVIITSAIFKLGKKALKTWELAIIGGIVLLSSFLGLHEVIALLMGGIIGGFYFYFKNNTKNKTLSVIIPFLLPSFIVNSLPSISITKIFLTFLKVGSILYGSGYVLFAYLDAEFVAKGLMTNAHLLDAIGIGQFTPGPVLSTATFIGFQLGGFWGSIAATTGMFLPSFLFVLLLNPFIPKMRKSKVLGYFLDSVNIAAVAVMLAVLITMSFATLVNWQSLFIMIVAGLMIFGPKKVSVIWVIVTGSVLGYILSLITF